jgi:hypothetical protein
MFHDWNTSELLDLLHGEHSADARRDGQQKRCDNAEWIGSNSRPNVGDQG